MSESNSYAVTVNRWEEQLAAVESNIDELPEAVIRTRPRNPHNSLPTPE